MPAQTPSTRLPSLDGWRAVSIALVLVCHSTFTTGFPISPESALFEWSRAMGIIGVRFFFVISGFLITHLLLCERRKYGVISLKNFYLRRAIRILPVCFFYLTVLACFTKYSQPAVEWFANFTFTTDFLVQTHPTCTGHLWSLGAEEQFYILWPCILAVILNRPDGVSQLVKFLCLPLIVAPAVRLIDYEHVYPESLRFLFYQLSFFTKFDSLAYGCLAALLYNHGNDRLKAFWEKKFLAGALGIILLIAVYILPFHGRFSAAFLESFQAVGFSVLLLLSIYYPARGFNRVLNWKWVAHIGILSYSIYIWQQMFCGTGEAVFGMENPWWTRFPLWIFVALLTAYASYYLLERPLMGLREKLRKV